MIDFRLERQSVKALPMHDHTQEEILTRIEECGRIAYRSEDRITESSASEFVARIQKNGHLSVLEHANIVLEIPYADADTILSRLGKRKIWHPFEFYNGGIHIAGNVRAWLETFDHYYPSVDEFERVGATLADAYPLLFSRYSNKFEPYDVVPQFVSPGVAYRTFIVRCDRGITHEIVRHRLFCLSGDTILPSFTGAKRWSVSQLYNWQHDPKLKGHIKRIRLRSLSDSGVFVPGKIARIVYSGKQELYSVVTQNGKSIKATKAHRFLTGKGWLRVEDLRIGDCLAVNGIEALDSADFLRQKYLQENLTLLELAQLVGCCTSTVTKALRRHGINKPLTMRKNKRGGTGRVKGSLSESERQALSFRMSGDKNPSWKGDAALSSSGHMRAVRNISVTSCSQCGADKNLQRHHIDKNPLNNTENNIQILCSACHKAMHSKFSAKTFVYDRIISITSCGVEDTYDVTMANEPHNFIANGIVSHNSFTQESSRYVRYGSHVPSFYMREPNSEEYIKFIYGCLDNYQAALRKGESPQEARDYLPNCLMSTIAISGYLPAWKHFCDLRSGKGAHPRIQELAKEVKDILDI